MGTQGEWGLTIRMYGVFLTPLVSTEQALWLVNADDTPALGTGPPLLFILDELLYAVRLYVLEMVEHTHAIFGSVPLVQALQPVAGKVRATKAEPGFSCRHLLACFDAACRAGFRLENAVIPAAEAWILISCICAAKTAVHSAGSDQIRGHIGRSF
jgi:hypothetical protein